MNSVYELAAEGPMLPARQCFRTNASCRLVSGRRGTRRAAERQQQHGVPFEQREKGGGSHLRCTERLPQLVDTKLLTPLGSGLQLLPNQVDAAVGEVALDVAHEARVAANGRLFALVRHERAVQPLASSALCGRYALGKGCNLG